MRHLILISVFALLVYPATAQDAVPTTPTSEATATVEPQIPPEQTAEVPPSAVPESTSEAAPEATAEATSSPVPEVTTTPEAAVTAESTAEMTAERTEAPTDPARTAVATSEITAENTPAGTAEITAPPEITPEADAPPPTATPSAYVLQFMDGAAYYQARSDHAGIRVAVFDEAGVWLSSAETDAAGMYTIAIPQGVAYWLRFDAPLHQLRDVQGMAGAEVSAITLLGGDLNDDGCIGNGDLDLLRQHFQQTDPNTDISGDGITDLSDLAILTGNLDPACEAASAIESTPEATEITIDPLEPPDPQATASPPEATPGAVIEATPEVTQVSADS